MFLLCVFFVQASKGQQHTLTKSGLYDVFKSSVLQDSKRKIAVGSNAWRVCNTRNSYYSSDTLTLVNGESPANGECCEFVEWTFFKKNEFIFSKSDYCKEPPTRDARAYWHSITIDQNKSHLILTVLKEQREVARFRLLSYEKQNGHQVIKLVRRR